MGLRAGEQKGPHGKGQQIEGHHQQDSIEERLLSKERHRHGVADKAHVWKGQAKPPNPLLTRRAGKEAGKQKGKEEFQAVEHRADLENSQHYRRLRKGVAVDDRRQYHTGHC